MNKTIQGIKDKVEEYNATLLVVSKKRSLTAVKEMYDLGFRHMGENRVQDLVDKKDDLPADIHWHIIGSLQRNKVKYIADFVHKIHSVDSLKLANEINKQAQKHERTIPILIQFKVAEEEAKQGVAPSQLRSFFNELLAADLHNIRVEGIMGMASFTDDEDQVRSEFSQLRNIFETIKEEFSDRLPHFQDLSMGMSGDYVIALEEGSSIVRLGSILFNSLDA